MLVFHILEDVIDALSTINITALHIQDNQTLDATFEGRQVISRRTILCIKDQSQLFIQSVSKRSFGKYFYNKQRKNFCP